MPAALHLVVGPSGAGKDTLMAEALKRRGDIHYVERVITRPSDAGGEQHRGVDEAEFERLERGGAFALSWRAHGLSYGLPATLCGELRQGRHVIANASRAVLPEARARFDPLRILSVEASPETRARRLAQRGRESTEEIELRLRRATPDAVEGPEVWRIDNNGALEDGVAAFLAALAPPLEQ